MLRIGLTGGIACGKSAFSAMLIERGCLVLDADDVSHGLVEPGGEALPALVSKFGSGILSADGGLDRRELAQRVFNDQGARAAVNAIMHPLIKEKIALWLNNDNADTVKVVAIPLLFEVGWQKGWDLVICLASSEELQIDRMVRTRGYSPEEARKRISAQMPVAEKAALADLTVWNNADLAALEREADRVAEHLKRMKNDRRNRDARAGS